MTSDELPPIPENATLAQWQGYVDSLVRARGWNTASDLEVFLLFTEEVGEFAKALRRQRRLFDETTPESTEHKLEIAEEMADLFSYLLDLANRTGVDLERAVIDKEKRNRQRTWSAPPEA